MKFAASTPAFDRALSVEIAASEQIRMRVLAGTLAILLLGDQLLFLLARETLEQFAGRLLPTWLPLKVFGPLAQRKAQVEPHSVLDDNRRKVVAVLRTTSAASLDPGERSKSGLTSSPQPCF